MAVKPSILALLLVFSIAALPLSGLGHSHAPEDGAGHTHRHSHDGHTHSHHHSHSDDGDGDEDHDEDGPSREDDHHSVLDDTPCGAMISRSAARWVEMTMLVLPRAMAVQMASISIDLQHSLRAKPPPWPPPGRSCQIGQLQTIILLV